MEQFPSISKPNYMHRVRGTTPHHTKMDTAADILSPTAEHAPQSYSDRMQSISAHAMAQMELMVNTFRKHHFTELELLIVQQNLPHGVAFETMKRMYDTLVHASTNGVFRNKPKATYIDYFYRSNVRVRYTTGHKHPVYIRKTPLARVDMECIQRPGFYMRFNLKDEAPVRKYVADDEPILVRLIEAWDFVYKDRFTYTIKKVATGTDKQDACKQKPSYEIEVELHRNTDYLENTDDSTIAHSFIGKAIDILGRWNNQTKTQDSLVIELRNVFAPDRNNVKRKRDLIQTRPSKEPPTLSNPPTSPTLPFQPLSPVYTPDSPSYVPASPEH